MLSDEQIAALRSRYGVTSNGRGIREFTQVCDFARAVLAAAEADKAVPDAWLFYDTRGRLKGVTEDVPTMAAWRVDGYECRPVYFALSNKTEGK
jgi:hypothetical protein